MLCNILRELTIYLQMSDDNNLIDPVDNDEEGKVGIFCSWLSF